MNYDRAARSSKWLLAMLMCLSVAVSANAGLTWEQQHIKRVATAADEQAVAAFAFTNTGEDPVTIASVTTSCGCTTASLEKQTYAPGETGRIEATFTFGDRVGKQVKRITVKTDDPQQPQQVLLLEVDIPRG